MDKVRAALETVKDEGTEIDSGSGMGSVDFWVTIDGREYFVEIKPSKKQLARDAQ